MEVLHNNFRGEVLHNNAVKGQTALEISRNREILHNNACDACGYSNFLGIGGGLPFWAKTGILMAGIVLGAYLIKRIT